MQQQRRAATEQCRRNDYSMRRYTPFIAVTAWRGAVDNLLRQ